MTLSRLLSAVGLILESERALGAALQVICKRSADIADCLHTASATPAGAQPLWTFDKGAARVAGARVPAKA